MELVKIAAAYRSAVAQIMRSLLEAEGLHPAPLHFTSHIGFRGGVDCWFIEVPVQEVSKAKAVLREAGHSNSLVK